MNIYIFTVRFLDLSIMSRLKFKRPEPLELLNTTHNDEFDNLKRLKPPRSRITPTSATTPSVAVYGKDHFKQLNTPSCVSLYFDSPKSAKFKDESPSIPMSNIDTRLTADQSNNATNNSHQQQQQFDHSHSNPPQFLPSQPFHNSASYLGNTTESNSSSDDANGDNNNNNITVIKINPNQSYNSGVLIKTNNETFNIIVDYNQPNPYSVYSEPSYSIVQQPQSVLSPSLASVPEMMDEENNESHPNPVPTAATSSSSSTSSSNSYPGNIVSCLLTNPEIWASVTKAKKGLYSCNHCDQKFLKLLYLAQHMDEAGIERPFRCHQDNCAWSIIGFSKRSEWLRHVKFQHDEKPKYKCEFPTCYKSFSRKDSLKRHFILVHASTSYKEKKKSRTKK